MPRTDAGLLSCWRQTARKRGSIQEKKKPCQNAMLDWVKKGDEKRKMEELQQQKVNQMIKSAEGSAGLLHKITKPTAWRGRARILKKEEDVRLLGVWEAKRKELAKHWQCGEDVQNAKEKPWTNEELRKLEEALPRTKECEFEKCRDCTRQRQECDVTAFTKKFSWI